MSKPWAKHTYIEISIGLILKDNFFKVNERRMRNSFGTWRIIVSNRHLDIVGIHCRREHADVSIDNDQNNKSNQGKGIFFVFGWKKNEQKLERLI